MILLFYFNSWSHMLFILINLLRSRALLTKILAALPAFLLIRWQFQLVHHLAESFQITLFTLNAAWTVWILQLISCRNSRCSCLEADRWWAETRAEYLQVLGVPMNRVEDGAVTLNLRPELDFNINNPGDDTLNHQLNIDNLNPPINLVKDCNYYSEHSFIQKFANSKQPLLISLNIQSLISKYQNLRTLIDL